MTGHARHADRSARRIELPGGDAVQPLGNMNGHLAGRWAWRGAERAHLIGSTRDQEAYEHDAKHATAICSKWTKQPSTFLPELAWHLLRSGP